MHELFMNSCSKQSWWIQTTCPKSHGLSGVPVCLQRPSPALPSILGVPALTFPLSFPPSAGSTSESPQDRTLLSSCLPVPHPSTHLGCGRSERLKWSLWTHRLSGPGGHRQSPRGRRGRSPGFSWCCPQPLQQREEMRVNCRRCGGPTVGTTFETRLEWGGEPHNTRAGSIVLGDSTYIRRRGVGELWISQWGFFRPSDTPLPYFST